MHIKQAYYKRLLSITFTLLITFSLITLLHAGTQNLGAEGDFKMTPQDYLTLYTLKLPPVSLKISVLTINGSINLYIKLSNINNTIFKLTNITHGIWYCELPFRDIYSFIIEKQSGIPYYNIIFTLFGFEKDFVLLDQSLLFVNIMIIIVYYYKKRNLNE